MNNTKWKEIFQAFYYGIECSNDPALSGITIRWSVTTTSGLTYTDCTWSHFACPAEDYKDIESLRIDLTATNRQIVMDTLRKIHVPGEVFDHYVIVYGYRMDVDYICHGA